MRTLIAVLLLGSPSLARAQAPATPPPATQNPSPVVEHTRVHERLVPRELAGITRTFAGRMGKGVELFIPATARGLDSVDVVIHFLGAAWLPEQAVAALPRPTIAAVVNLGAGSGIYDRAFTDPAAFDSLLAGITREAAAATGHRVQLGRVTLVGFSAGHGAVRAILRDPRHFARVDAVLLLDGMHTSYIPDRTPLAAGGTIDSTNLVAFERFARAAVRGEKRFLVTHSEIFPGTFASTTETADWLLAALGLRRIPVLRWGPRGMQQLSEVRAGQFELMGFAGNSAPDHIDQLHSMPEMLARLLAEPPSDASASPAAGYGVRAAYALVPGADRMRGRLELLEDARIAPPMRAAILEAWGGDPCLDNRVPALAPLCDVPHRTPLRPALLRLVDATGRLIASDTLERPLADLAVATLYGSTRRSYMLTVDLSAGIGTYSGPYARFAEPDSGAFGWVTDVDTFGRAPDTLTLVSTPKTAWRGVSRADGRGLDSLMVLCRPDFEAPPSAADSLRFLLTFDRYTFDGRRWERRRRQEHGCWESRDSSDFPARVRFP